MAEQQIGDLEAIRARLETWLQRALPARPGLHIPELRFPEASGESSVTLLFEAHWPDGATRRFVGRMVPPRSEVFESHDLRMQVEMMRILRAEGLPAPNVVGYEPDPSLLGSDFYVMDFVEGRIPPDKPPMAFGSWVMTDLDATARARMWSNGLETLAAIHRIDPTKHDLSRLPRAEPGEPLAAAELRKWNSMFTPALRETADPVVVRAWKHLMQTAPRDGELRLCWGDSRPGNVIWRDERPVAVIDWEMANLADPLSDLTWWVWIDRINCIGLGADPIPGVPAPDEVYAAWHELTGIEVANVPWFELFTATRYAIVLELKFQALRERQPEAVIPNFTVPFVGELLARI